MAKYKSKTFKISLPKSLHKQLHDSLKLNPPTFEYQIEGFYGILRDIVVKMGKKENGMVPLFSGILQDKYINYRDLLDYLYQNNIITEDSQYWVDNSRKFGIKNPLSFETIELEIRLDSYYGRYVKKRHNVESRKAKSKPEYYRIMRNHFYKIKYDVDAALEELDDLIDILSIEQYMDIKNSILCFSNGGSKNNLYFKRESVDNRIHSNLVNLKSYFKKYIISDSDLIQIDINNSQPVFFNIILDIVYDIITTDDLDINSYLYTLCYSNKELKGVVSLVYQEIRGKRKWVDLLKEEIPKYKYFTSNGTWYNHLADIYNKKYNTQWFDRNNAKSLWMGLAYSKNKESYYSGCKKAFEETYPGIGKFMRLLKKKDYKLLSRLLQNIESYVFIDNVCPKLIEQGIIPLTIHDAVIIREDEYDAAYGIIQSELRNHLGFTPILDSEYLGDLEFKQKINTKDVAKKVRDMIVKLSDSKPVNNHDEASVVKELDRSLD